MLKIYTRSSFILLCLAMILPQIMTLAMMNLYSFKNIYKCIRPKFSKIKLNMCKNLIGLGVKFFFIQIAALMILATDNIIIAKLIGPGDVTPYNIAFKYMMAGSYVFIIILGPAWSAFTEAHTLNDQDWIIRTIKRFLKAWLSLIAGLILLVAFSQPIYTLWIGKDVIIPEAETQPHGLCSALQ